MLRVRMWAQDMFQIDPEFAPLPAPSDVHLKVWKMRRLFRGRLAMHPRKSILATCSDDGSWKMWSIPNGDLIMSGDGHKDWLSCVDFHPRFELFEFPFFLKNAFLVGKRHFEAK